MRTLYWHPTGPKLAYSNGVFFVEDLNPELHTHWGMSRWDMVRLAWRTFVAALR